MSISLEHIIPAERVVFLKATTKEGALREMVAVAAREPEVGDEAKLLEAILEREKIMSTGIGLGIAVPHAKVPFVTDFIVSFGKAPEGLQFNSLDGNPVQFVVLIAGPEGEQERYLQLLARITLKLKEQSVRRQLSEAMDVDAILAALR
ncbi:MAG: PTS sugar transporter subunit IIA [Planctomycetota bacterium]|nr:PTS sugar transporter subunit IIA [Planctomycetota bacterium]